MSLSPSPPREIKPVKKKAFMFKKANFGNPSNSTSNDELSFFSRGRENYVGVVEPREEEQKEQKEQKEPEVKKEKKKAHRQDGDDGDDGAGSPPKRVKRGSATEDDDDEDSGEEISNSQKRHANARRRYKHAVTLSDSDSPPSGLGRGSKNNKKPTSGISKPRVRDTSLTPPPVLYADIIPPRPNTRRTTSANSPPASCSTSNYGNPSFPTMQANDTISDGDDVVLTNVAAAAKGPVDEDEEMLAALERRARERAAATRASDSSTNLLSPPPPSDTVVSILVTSDLENTRPLIVHRRLKQSLKVVREAWCTRQGFAGEESADIFLTWKGNKVFDHNTCYGIGIGVDDLGNLADQDGTRDNNVHFEAMTAEMLAEREREREMRYETEALPEVEEAKEETVVSMRLTLKSKGYEDFKLKVRPDTKIFKIVSAFRDARGVDESHDITLDFDGDTLNPDETVGDTELEDMFCIDVYVN